MQALNIEKTYRVLLGEVNRFRIMLVGCGGTGSSLALALAGLAYHARQKGIQIELTLVDHDTIQAGNVGRQHFGVASAFTGAIHKVSDISLRLNAAYGLDIVAWPEKYEAHMVRDWFNHNGSSYSQVHLIIGCVDGHLGRREIAKTVTAFDGGIWAIDSGNELHSGQVLIGNLTDVSRIRLDRLGLCSGLPSPYVQEPDLLEPDPAAPSQSCAEMGDGASLAETQSLMVNRMAAAIAAQYVATFVLQRQILQMGSRFNLAPPTMTSRLITETTIGQVAQVRRR